MNQPLFKMFVYVFFNFISLFGLRSLHNLHHFKIKNQHAIVWVSQHVCVCVFVRGFARPKMTEKCSLLHFFHFYTIGVAYTYDTRQHTFRLLWVITSYCFQINSNKSNRGLYKESNAAAHTWTLFIQPSKERRLFFIYENFIHSGAAIWISTYAAATHHFRSF